MNLKTLFMALLCLFCVNVAMATNDSAKESQGSDANVYGHVVDLATGNHLPYLNVSVKGTMLQAATDATGHFRLKNLPPGKHVIEVRAMGYRTATKEVEVRVKSSQEINFALTEDAISLDEVVVTANRSATLRREAPVLVSVIDAKIFENTNAMCMAQGLNFQPGVRTEDNCQNCGFSQVRINGLDGHYSQILIDSRPVFSSLNGIYGLEQIPSNMIERIEVVRGGGSALYGASAIGGTINVITKEPTRNSVEIAHTISSIEGKATFENNTTANASMVTEDGKAGFSLYGQYHYRPGFDHDGDSYTELPNLKNQTFGLNMFYKPSVYSKLSVQYHNIGEYRRGGNLLKLPPHDANIAEQGEHNVNAGNATYELATPNAKNRMKAYFSFSNTLRKSYYGGIADGSPESIETARKAYGRTTGLTYIAGAQYAHLFDQMLFMPATLTLGAEYNYDGLNDRIVGYGHEMEQKIRITSAFLQNEWKNKQWTLLVGGRLDKHNLIGHVIFSPRANLRYNPVENVNLRAIYSSGFRAPQTFDEDLHVGFAGGERIVTQMAKDLKEERSHSFSLSADLYHNFNGVQTNFLIEGFYTTLRHVFALRNLDKQDAHGNRIQERYNGSGAKVYGLNAESKAAFSKWFQLQMGITLQRSVHDEAIEWDEKAPREKNMLRTPSFYGYFTASSSPMKRLTLALSGNYTGKMLVGHAAHILEDGTEVAPVAVNTPAFFTINLKASYDIALSTYVKMQVNAGVQNMTNSYQKDFDRGWGRDSAYIYGPGTPRSFFAGVKISY